MEQHYRHGDLLIVRVAEVPSGAVVEQEPSVAGVVLAYGEVTGHAHRIEAGTASVWDVSGQRYITLPDGGTLTHEEHGPIGLAPGNYLVVQQREYTPEAVRLVAD